MKLPVIALALTATAFGSLSAAAQTAIITEERPPQAVVVKPAPPPAVVVRPAAPQAVVVEPAPTVTTTTQERGGFLGTEMRTTTETTGTGPNGECATRTVHNQNLLGERTVSQTSCP